MFPSSYNKLMSKSVRTHSNRTMIIVVAIVSTILALCLYGAYNGVREFQKSSVENAANRREKLQALMPTAPPTFSLVRDGYDPKANCFDKCGFEYRVYRYPSQDSVCRDVIGAIQRDARGLTLETARDEPIDENACAVGLAKAKQQTPGFQSFSAYIVATLRVQYDSGPVTDKVRYASVTLYPEKQEAWYTISQEYADYTFAHKE